MSSFQALFDLLGELARRRYQAAERSLAPMGLNYTEARLLVLLQQEGGSASQDTISGGLSVDRSNAGRALRRLEQFGHIRKQLDADDKRANFIQITAKGRKAASQVSKLRRNLAQGFFGALKEHEADVVLKLLNKSVNSKE